MIAAQLVFRAWAIYPSWFFTDDYRLMLLASRSDLNWSYLTEAFDSQFMPFGKLITWLLVDSGQLNWPLAASISLCLQAMATIACLWMLVTLFGPRWGILAPLGIYLTNAMTMPAFMWWAASLNQIPMQIAFFLAVGCWVRHLRSQQTRWLAATTAALGIGLLCYVKSLLIVPVLAVIAVAYFADGAIHRRVAGLLRTYWLSAVLGTVMVSSYVVYYIVAVPTPFESGDSGQSHAGEVADGLLGTSLITGLLGGPWRWWRTSPPIVLAQPPEWSIHVAWSLLTLLVAFSVLRRRHALSGWLLLGGYAFCAYVLLLTTRGQLYGRFAGLEYRYLTDVTCVLVLCIGLIFLEVPGAPGSSRARANPRLRVSVSPAWVGALVLVIASAGIMSSWRYVEYWHQDNAGRAYTRNLAASLGADGGSVELAEQTLPGDVMPEYTQPMNSSRQFLELYDAPARFPESSAALNVIDPGGVVRPAYVKTGVTSRTGPVDDCGWRVGERGKTIPLSGEAFSWSWWLRIGYLASSDSSIEVSAGGSTVEAQVRRGLNSLFVNIDGPFSHVSIAGLDPGTTLCVDTIEVGDPVPETEGSLP